MAPINAATSAELKGLKKQVSYALVAARYIPSFAQAVALHGITARLQAGTDVCTTGPIGSTPRDRPSEFAFDIGC